MKKLQIFASEFLAGALVGIAGLAFLLLRETHPFAAAMMFGAALIAILTLNLHLFTAKAGYLLWDSRIVSQRAVHLVVSFCGNAFGAVCTGVALGFVYPDRSFAKAYVAERLTGNTVGTIVGSLFCGILMFAAVHGYIRSRNGIGGALVLFGASATVMLCNFNHSITDLFFAAFTRMLSARILAMLIVVAIGNLVGSVLFALLYEYKKSDEEAEREAEKAEEAYERHMRHRARRNGDTQDN